MVREMGLSPVDVIGFSAGGYIAAEMAAADPNLFSSMILVAPMGLKPDEGEIMDFLAMTMRTHLRATVADITTPEFGGIYGGEMTPEQFDFILAINQYKSINKRPFPSWTEVLDIIKALGYRRVEEPQDIQ